MIDAISTDLEEIRSSRPLVHSITNYVVMNFTANILLALGASPVMAHAEEEMEEMVGISSALVINIGTLSSPWVDSMLLAARAAERKSIPVVLDPVGAGATRFRTETARRLAEEFRLAVVRGNASEILALAGRSAATKGVDSGHGTGNEARFAALELARTRSVTVAVTGAEDFVTDGRRAVVISNGNPLMGRVTGTGCSASAIAGAFCAVQRDSFVAATGALVTFGIAGELAARSKPGVGTYQSLLLDSLDRIDGNLVRENARCVEFDVMKWENGEIPRDGG